MAKKILSASLVIFLLLSAIGCKKWRDNRETITSENHTLAEACFNDVFRNVLMATSPVGELLTDSCFTIQKSGNTFPQTVTVDFGSAGCTGLFEHEMQGRIVLVLNDSMHHAGAIADVSLENFYSNKYHVEGTLLITNTGASTSGYPEYDVKVENGIITAEEEKTGEKFTVSWTSEYHHTLTERNNELLMFDDLFAISGSASGTNEEGRNFTATIKGTLQKYLNCRWPGSGETTIAADDLKERDLSYGECTLNATCCDGEATEIVKFTDRTVRMR